METVSAQGHCLVLKRFIPLPDSTRDVDPKSQVLGQVTCHDSALGSKLDITIRLQTRNLSLHQGCCGSVLDAHFTIGTQPA